MVRLIAFLLIFSLPVSVQAQSVKKQKIGASLRYNICHTPRDSNVCFIAFHKMRRIINPINRKKFFDDGIHYLENGQLFMYPTFAVAQPDLDGDGFKELITVPHEQEETLGMFCKKPGICPHFIFQDRNIPGKKPSLRNFKLLGKMDSAGIGLSTDEVIGGYRSLRAYKDTAIKTFDVYQYDRKNDEYFNISGQ